MNFTIFFILYIYYYIKIVLTKNIDVAIKLTELYEKRKLYSKGLRVLTRFRKKHTLDENELYRIDFRTAYFFMLLGDIDSAISRFEDLFNKVNEGTLPSQYLLINLIELYNRNKDFNKAKEIIQKYLAIPVGINDECLLFNSGNTYLGLKKYNTALDYYSQAVQLVPSFKDEIYFNMGLCKYHLHDYSNSLNLFNESLKLSDRKEKKAEIHYAIGIVYKEWNDKDSALNHFHEADKLGYEKAKEALNPFE